MGTQSKEFYAKPLDFTEPLHFNPFKSAFLSVLSGMIVTISFSSLPQLIWVGFIPLWLGVVGRKDKGVFGLGCLSGLTIVISLSLLNTQNTLTLIWPFFLGFWLWISRKIYFYMAFPKVSQTLADAPRKQFILPWYKLILVALTSSFIYITLEILFGNFTEQMKLGLSQNAYPSMLKISSFTGLSGLSFLIIFSNISLALFLEVIVIVRKTIPPWQLIIISISVTVSTLLCANYSLQREPKVPMQVSSVTINSKEELSPKFIKNKIRDGLNVVIVEDQMPANLKKFAIIRSMEFGVSIVFLNHQIILPDGKITDSLGIPKTINFKPTFYYRNTNFFTNIVFAATFIAFLVTGLHFYKRKTILRDLISGKD